MMRFAVAAITVSLVFGASGAQALENENLLVSLPRGYKVGYHKSTPKGVISEMVPAAETVENWTEMVTVQIFLNMRDVTPAQYRDRMQKLWAAACPGSEFSKVEDGAENGYPTLTWLQKCPKNQQTGKPEFTWLKALQGKDSFIWCRRPTSSSRLPNRCRGGAVFSTASASVTPACRIVPAD